MSRLSSVLFFFFQAEDGIRDGRVTGVQTCALPIWSPSTPSAPTRSARRRDRSALGARRRGGRRRRPRRARARRTATGTQSTPRREIGRASCRERGEMSEGGVSVEKKKGE